MTTNTQKVRSGYDILADEYVAHVFEELQHKPLDQHEARVPDGRHDRHQCENDREAHGNAPSNRPILHGVAHSRTGDCAWNTPMRLIESLETGL